MRKYNFLFFDLDCTLWDYENNAAKALEIIFEKFELGNSFNNQEHLISLFSKYNDLLWNEFREGRIHKEVLRIRRFEMCLSDVGIENRELAVSLNENFLDLSPKSTGLMPGTIEILDYLKEKKYNLFIITNGFTQIQELKMKYSGLEAYFEKMFTSENVGSNKPNREMFEYAVKSVNAIKKQSLMIGDDLKVDIIGARKFGIDQVFYNPKKISHSETVTYEIEDLLELRKIL
jgi:putative hydrolase of the HAD superfamily